MAIFDKEAEFYKGDAKFVSDKSLASQFIEFIVDKVFILNIVSSFIILWASNFLQEGNAFMSLGYFIGVYLTLISIPAMIAAFIALPGLLLWNRCKSELFKAIFELVFVVLYLLFVLLVLVGMLGGYIQARS